MKFILFLSLLILSLDGILVLARGCCSTSDDGKKVSQEAVSFQVSEHSVVERSEQLKHSVSDSSLRSNNILVVDSHLNETEREKILFLLTLEFQKWDYLKDTPSQSKLNKLSSSESSTKELALKRRKIRKLYDTISDEARINDQTSNSLRYPIALDLEQDRILILWLSQSNKNAIKGQIHDIFLNKIESEFQVNSDTNQPEFSDCYQASLLQNGSYVVTWRAEASGDIYARIMNDMVPSGDEFKVNIQTDGDQGSPGVSGLFNGDFLIVWTREVPTTGYYALARQYESNGNPISIEELILNFSTTSMKRARSTALSVGGFAVVWNVFQGTQKGCEVYIEAPDADGFFIDNLFVATYADDSEYNCSIATLITEDLVMAWHRKHEETLTNEIYAEILHGNGSESGGDFIVNEITTEEEQHPHIIAMKDGGFLITWESIGILANVSTVYARRYDYTQAEQGSELLISSSTNYGNTFPCSAPTSHGFITAWESSRENGSNSEIYARSYIDSCSVSLHIENNLSDITIYESEGFVFTIPENTAAVSPVQELTYYAKVISYDDIEIDSEWLVYDSLTRTMSGTPPEAGAYTIEVKVVADCVQVSDQFILTVIFNSDPVLHSPIPTQVIPLNTRTIWEYQIPKNTFRDNEGDEISYTDAFMMINSEERELNSVWESLKFEDDKLFGIPNLSGEFTVRIYANDGVGDISTVSVDIHIEIFSQGIETLDLYEINQRGFRGLISKTESYIWTSSGKSLKKFEVISENPLFIQSSDIEYNFREEIKALVEIDQDRIVVGDSQGYLTMVSTEVHQEMFEIYIDEPITSIIFQESEEYIYVSHVNTLSALHIMSDQLAIDWEIQLESPISSIAKMNEIIYAGTDGGLFQIDTTERTSEHNFVLNSMSLKDVAIFESYLYTTEGSNLYIIDISNSNELDISKIQELSDHANSLALTKKDGDTLCLAVGEQSLTIFNVQQEISITEGYYSSNSSINQIYLQSTGKWGVLIKENSVSTVELFRRELLLETCDTNSDPCTNELNIQAKTDFSKDISMIEMFPVYKTGYVYNYKYAFSAQQIVNGINNPLPSWLVYSQEGDKVSRLTGSASDVYIELVLDIEITAHVFNSDEENVLNVHKLVSVSVVPREASLLIPIPDQSLVVGEEWLFSFPENTFSDASTFECEYTIEDVQFNSNDLDYIIFTPALRQWYINPANSNKETLFNCNPCDSNQYSIIYTITVTGRNSDSDTDTGVSDTFDLIIYSGRIPDQETHPGISKTIILDEDIFPIGIDYTVALLDVEGNSQSLPSWMSFIDNERKILMFPTVSELDQDFHIQVRGDNNGDELKSEFTIKVRNQAPIAMTDLERQRVKLGTQLEYTIPPDAFVDPDDDVLTFSIKRITDDGELTDMLPSWMYFNTNSQLLYGIPFSVSTFNLLVYAEDGLGGEVHKELVIEAYNNAPERNPEVELPNQTAHIGSPMIFTLNSELFRDLDGDSLTYTANQSDGSSLPNWLDFNTVTLSFSAMPTDGTLLLNPVDITVTASDGYASSSSSFQLIVTNLAPEIDTSIDSQVLLALNQGSIRLKPGIRFDFVFSTNTFKDPDGDSLAYSARSSDGNPLPEWLNFDATTRQFIGNPTEDEDLSISVTASDGYASVVDTFSFNILNKPPVLENPLQTQFDSLYPDFLLDGMSLFFQFSTNSFLDEDDSLTHTALFREDKEGNWRSLEFSWILLEERTFTGIVSANSIQNSTLYLQVTASDGFKAVSDEFYIDILSIFPASSEQKLHIQSLRNSIEVELSTNSSKLALFDHGTVSPRDISNRLKIDWLLEGSPSDINYIMERIKYRATPGRILEEDTVTLKLNGHSQEYPISILTAQESISTSSIPDQIAYMDNTFSLSVKKYFNYSSEDDLTYSFDLEEEPQGSKDWLNFDLRTISGTPIDTEDIGKYKVTISATDEFDETASESFYIEVNYTDLQLLIIYMNLIFSIFGPIFTTIGLFVYRSKIANAFTRSKKLYSALEIKKNETTVRQFFLLRSDEERMAKKLYSQLEKNYDLDHQNLAADLDCIVQEMNYGKKDPQSVIPDKYEIPSSILQSTSFEYCLKMNEHSLITIKKHDYHAQYLYLSVKDLVLKESLVLREIEKLDHIVTEFKKDMKDKYEYKLMEIYQDYSIPPRSIGKDTWTMLIPGIGDSLSSEIEEIDNYLEHLKLTMFYEVFYNRIRLEFIKDRAIRINEKSDLKRLRLFYETRICKMKREKEIEFWLCQTWFKVNITDNDIKIILKHSERKPRENLYVQIFDRKGYLLLETRLLPAPTPATLTALEEDSQCGEEVVLFNRWK